MRIPGPRAEAEGRLFHSSWAARDTVAEEGEHQCRRRRRSAITVHLPRGDEHAGEGWEVGRWPGNEARWRESAGSRAGAWFHGLAGEEKVGALLRRWGEEEVEVIQVASTIFLYKKSRWPHCRWMALECPDRILKPAARRGK